MSILQQDEGKQQHVTQKSFFQSLSVDHYSLVVKRCISFFPPHLKYKSLLFLRIVILFTAFLSLIHLVAICVYHISPTAHNEAP